MNESPTLEKKKTSAPARAPQDGASRYGAAFQADIVDGSLTSARRIVPAVVDLIRPGSVADIGCGTAAWLSVFRENGVEDVMGVDGDYIDRKALLIPLDRFRGADVSGPLALGRRFDLVMTVEVAEHLPAERAAAFVSNLVTHSDVVMFSAAIPNQGGEGHINEQWPSYWKPFFERHGYVLVDCLRRRFWEDRTIEKWYRQNLLLFVRRERLDADPRLRAEYEANRHQILSVVHPDMFYPLSLKQLLRSLPGSIRRALGRRL